MTEQIIISSATIIGMTIVALIALRGWQGWLALKERELDRARNAEPAMQEGSPQGAARIEIADLKERIRKLEAIASGVDL
ncbi:hypothetical protein HKD42_08465 [Altererythrobacter sp. RZ02]|uniref:Phage shock protein B n=1 Tax=Pontixanthobacter rizhaonensis TaxID=2730337 RepID=A0A848QHH5_9SPHN|nr:hypothetical protein [Pontixanthobacter rizhaonensis]NMW32092.1 hypothetical protein [Pontixanthobacter rizhaonensis]